MWLRAFRKHLSSQDARKKVPDEVNLFRAADDMTSNTQIRSMFTDDLNNSRRSAAAYNDSVEVGLSEDAKQLIRKGVWCRETALSDLEQRYIARRTPTTPLSVKPSPTGREVTAAQPFHPSDIIYKEASPLFFPQNRHCVGCDSPKAGKKAYSCKHCGASYCSEGCCVQHSRMHRVECAVRSAGVFDMLRETYFRGGYAGHSSLHLPHQAEFLAKPATNGGFAAFEGYLTVLSRALSMVQPDTPGRFIDPTQLPMFSVLPFIPIPDASQFGAHQLKMPIETTALFHIARITERVVGVDKVWDGHKEGFWNLWEMLVYNMFLGKTALHPVVSQFGHAAAGKANCSLFKPTNQLAFIVALRDIQPGEALTIDYLPNEAPGNARQKMLSAWRIAD